MIIRKNALVSIELTLQDENGNKLEDENNEIIYLQGGYGHLFAKLEHELEGKKVGDKVYVALSAVDAFGEINENLITNELLSDLPMDIEIDSELNDETDGGTGGVIYRIVEMNQTHALLDGNHPYAGMDFVVEANVLEIEYISDEAIAEILADNHHH